MSDDEADAAKAKRFGARFRAACDEWRRQSALRAAIPACCEDPAVPTSPIHGWRGADHLRCAGCASWWTFTARGWVPCQSDVRAILERSWRMSQERGCGPPQWGMNAICEGADGFGV